MNIPIKHPKGGYQIKYLLKDNYKIFKRNGWLEKLDSCVYIFCDNQNVSQTLPFIGQIEGQIKYIGMGRWNEPNIYSSRPFKHKNDNLEKWINPNRTCYILTGLTSEEAHVLEAYLLKHTINSGFELTSVGCNYSGKSGVLINKRRERKWEAEINNILLLENQW